NIQLYPEEVMNVINFDTFLFVYLGQYGDFKYIDDIKPSCYRLHPGGMWSSKSENFQQLSKINTNFWISKYFERTGEMYLRDHYGINIINRVLHSMIEPKWRNYYRIIAKMFAKKFLILSRLLKKLLVPDK